MKIPKQEYTPQFRELAVKRVRAGQTVGAVARELGLIEQTLALIQAINLELKGAYGSPLMVRELRGRGFPASKERVERLMREYGVRARHKRRFKSTTDSKHALPVAPNLLAREFTPTKPNLAWSADMTHIWRDEGWPYLAVVLDLFNREVVGWSIKPKMTADIVIDALTMAWFRRKPASGLVHHSGRGSQYASLAFQARLKKYGMVCSMSRKGNCWDNAPTESFFNSLKNERVHSTRYGTRAAAISDLFDYIEPFYNRRPRHSALDYASPEQFLKDRINSQHEKELAA